MTTTTAPAVSRSSIPDSSDRKSSRFSRGCGCQGRADLAARGLRRLAAGFEQRKGPALAAVLAATGAVVTLAAAAGYMLGRVTTGKDRP
jgi:hypothetical protein